ncbi:GntR family transcriptional regulator [Devosia sp. A8/3-2]|nr:GntR family transcriptional regulator [Devosia sp. A8/3-2]
MSAWRRHHTPVKACPSADEKDPSLAHGRNEQAPAQAARASPCRQDPRAAHPEPAISARQRAPPEPDLCETFGISRSAVREAIKVLDSKGMVTTRPRIGTVVRAGEAWNLLDPDVLARSMELQPSAELVLSLIEARQVIEPAAASLCRIAGDRRRNRTPRRRLCPHEPLQVSAGFRGLQQGRHRFPHRPAAGQRKYRLPAIVQYDRRRAGLFVPPNHLALGSPAPPCPIMAR